MSRTWRWLFPCYALLALNAIIAFLYAVLWCRAHSWEWRDGVLTFIAGTYRNGTTRLIGKPGGQGWSWIVGYASKAHRERADLRVHENVHVAQEFACASIGAICGAIVSGFGAIEVGVWTGLFGGGALFALLYGAMFLYYFATRQEDEQPGWEDDYRRNPFERHAYAVQARYLDGEIREVWGG